MRHPNGNYRISLINTRNVTLQSVEVFVLLSKGLSFNTTTNLPVLHSLFHFNWEKDDINGFPLATHSRLFLCPARNGKQ